jgi:hypothetical protein
MDKGNIDGTEFHFNKFVRIIVILHNHNIYIYYEKKGKINLKRTSSDAFFVFHSTTQ